MAKYRGINRRTKGYGNFYMQPGGVFYITKNNIAGISKVSSFSSAHVLYATQSAPMLVIDGKINPVFSKSSLNTTTRNGVGILPNGDVILAISKESVSFYEFAQFFQKAGCINALYMDGGISGAYLPNEGITKPGRGRRHIGYAVMIGVVKN